MRVTNTAKRKGFGAKRLVLLLPALLLLTFAVTTQVSAQGRNQSCKARVPVEINQKVLEAEVAKLRIKESSYLSNLFQCVEALPTLKKYALDPDPRVREEITRLLNDHYSAEALQTLVRQVETFPTEKSAFPISYAADYPCYFFKGIKARPLTQALATRIKSRNGGVKVEEIQLLGCLARRDVEARNLLEEMRQPSFPIPVSEVDRLDLRFVDFALAEAGMKEAEERVLADIEAQAKSGDPDVIRSSLFNELDQFTNCRILQRYAQFITDKRSGPLVKITNDFYDPRYKLESNQVQLRVGDVAIAHFASIYGSKVTGTNERDSLGSKVYTDEEMERIYQRVKKTLQGRRFSTCRSSK